MQEALREKEIEYEDKKDLSEEALRELNDVFNKIENGSSVEIKFYKNRKYHKVKGIVTHIDFIKKKIQINENLNINISDIVDIYL